MTTNKRSREDIHPGDRVRLLHTLRHGICLSENSKFITVKMFGSGNVVTSFRNQFVPAPAPEENSDH